MDDANAAVSRAESIRSWRLLDSEFSEESGYLTPTQKLKRNVVTKDYRDEIASIYG